MNKLISLFLLVPSFCCAWDQELFIKVHDAYLYEMRELHNYEIDSKEWHHCLGRLEGYDYVLYLMFNPT